MDLATVLGLIGGFGLMAIAIILGGSPGAFLDLPAFLIVVGGTFFITVACFSLGEVLNSQIVVAKTVLGRPGDPSEAAIRMLQLSERARKDGVLGLERHLSRGSDDQFLSKAMDLVLDGTQPDEIEKILRIDVNSMSARHVKGAGVLRKAAEISPAMGLIGTLIGLVQMLGRLDDPATIGPAMAVALLTTFYGAVLANMVFSPLASKLERNSMEEALLHNIYLSGASSIGRQENPRRLEMLLNTMLPPAKRVQYFS
jgi:chemotaxis protein MotA